MRCIIAKVYPGSPPRLFTETIEALHLASWKAHGWLLVAYDPADERDAEIQAVREADEARFRPPGPSH